MIVAISLIGALSMCSKKARYEALVEEGLSSGVRHDTLFLGLTLGMTSKDFYSQCWELNKQGVIRQGSGNTSVLYTMEDEFKSTINANFYPTFHKDKIYEMPVRFQYESWAPWNSQYSTDTLKVELVDLFEEWYGKGFIQVENETRGDAFVKVDGNRRISIYSDPNQQGVVWALYTDMSVDEEVKALTKNATEEQ